MPAVSSKFGPQFVGPFRVLERIGRLVYHLQLPPNMKMHDVVSVAQLEPTTDPGSDQYGRRPPPPGPTVVDNEEEWEGERLLSKRSRRIGRAKSKSTKYLVRWVAHGPEHDVWMTVKRLDHCQELIDESEACQKEGVFTSIPKDHQRATAVGSYHRSEAKLRLSVLRKRPHKQQLRKPNTPIPGNEQRAICRGPTKAITTRHQSTCICSCSLASTNGHQSHQGTYDEAFCNHASPLAPTSASSSVPPAP